MDPWNSVTVLSLGLGLAAACGFRAFLPPLLIGIFTRAELVTVSDSWQWFSSDWAIALFATAALFEIFAYLIPWLDNLLDSLATPLAITTGTIMTCASLDGIDPSLQWILAVITGVGLTGSIQISTVVIRGLSTATTGGLGNPIFTILEDILSVLLILSATFLPILSLALVIIIVLSMKGLINQLRKRKNHKK